MSKVKIKKTDITKVAADAIVNAANSGLWAGSGVCGAIFSAAGHAELQKACDAIGHCNTGDAVITPAFKLNAKYIIHAVGPQWNGGHSREPQLLYNAYTSALDLARKYGCHSIAFPLLSAGIYGYPVAQAWNVALFACRDYLDKHSDLDLDIEFAVLDETILKTGQKTLQKLKI